MMQLTQDQEQVLAMQRLWIFRQFSQCLRRFPLIEMNVYKGEAHGEHEEWYCEQKDDEAPYEHVIHAGTL